MTAAAAADQLLKTVLGSNAEFREGQLEAILSLVQDSARALVIQRTGWGKSLVYFVATRLLRDRGTGATILISPLLSLVRDQRQSAAALELRARSIDSTNTSHWRETEDALRADEVDILLVSPERLGNDHFQQVTLREAGSGSVIPLALAETSGAAL